MHMTLLRGFAFARINANQFGAIALGLLRKSPKMNVAGNRVTAPNDDQFGFREKLCFHAQLATQGVGQAFTAGRGTNGPVQKGCAQLMKKP